MIKEITLYKQSMRGNDHMVIATPDSYNPKTQRILVSVNNKVAEATYNPQTKNATAKLDVLSTNANHPLATQLPQTPDVRVKVFVYDFMKDRILGAKLQEFELNTQTFDYHPTDEIVSTAPVILGAFDLKGLAVKAKKEEGIILDYFVKAWWTDENDNPINEALLNDTVNFHLETKGIPNNEIVFVTLYDDDRRVNLKEDGKNEKMKLVYSSNGKEVVFAKVKNNKVTLTLNLENFDSFLKNEPDGSLEFFFACSYVNPKTKISYNKDLPANPKDYLKVKEREPLIIYVSGYWNKDMPLAGSEWGEKYWGEDLKRKAKEYFHNTSKEYFINGAGEKGDGGKKRFSMGSKIATERFKNKKSNFYNEVFSLKRKILIISHSMGGAFAEGMISIMKQKGVNIEKIIHFSPADVSGFMVNLPEITFQIDIYVDPVLLYKNFDDGIFIENIKYWAIGENPFSDIYGHMYTKEKEFAWNWFEDLELVNFKFYKSEKISEILPSLGASIVAKEFIIKKYYAMNLKHNMRLLRIYKFSKFYNYDKESDKYYTKE